jgi:putative protease
MGYNRFMVNNIGHFSLFRNKENAVLIAGPWLYAFNIWAWDFLKRCGAEYCVSPLENNRQNLQKTFQDEKQSAPNRSRTFVTVLARPSLFRISSNLGSLYGFENFTDSKGESFRLAPSQDGTLAYPQERFSIVDKIPFLREAGFNRFILDFSDRPLKKADYRETMEAVNRASHIPGTNRFNWKNGFYKS